MDMGHLNGPQRQAVLHGDAPLLVLAGAGSGKTSVITYRVAHLVAARQVPPWRILGMTFTNKAARQMRARAAALVGCEEQALTIGTFHRICGRILRQHGPVLGLSSRFVIYDADDQLQLIRRCAEAAGLDGTAFPPRALRATIETWKNQGLLPDQVRPSPEPLARRAHQIYAPYQRRLAEADAVDFSDMMVHVLTLLRHHPEVAQALQQRWSHILVDEYQDTNAVQYALLRALTTPAHGLTVVGDDDQSIYRWRGADIGNILRFERDFPGATVIRLEQNYRSTATILAAANAVIAHNVARKGKNLFTADAGGERLAFHMFPTEREEAAHIARSLAALTAAGVPAGELAVLTRTNAQSRPVEEALRRQHLPYTVYGGLRFYDRREIKDALAYLRVIDNPRSTLDFLRAATAPSRGLGRTTLTRVSQLAEQDPGGILAAARAAAAAPGVLAGRARTALASFCALLDGLIAALAAGEGLGRVLEQALADSGYLAALKEAGAEEADDRIANLRELVAALDEYQDTQENPTLSGFLEDVALSTDADQAAPGGQVVLATLHAAKGLEFHAVFMPGMEEGLFPHSRSLEDRAALEEERRLCYVGITRAKRELTLSAVRVRNLFGRPTLGELSRFVGELPPELVEVHRDGAAAQPGTAGIAAAVGIAAQGRSRPWLHEDVPTLAPGELPVVRDEGGGAYARGARVLHATFGEGEVVGTEGAGARQKLTVSFAGVGRKVIVARFVQPA